MSSVVSSSLCFVLSRLVILLLTSFHLSLFFNMSLTNISVISCMFLSSLTSVYLGYMKMMCVVCRPPPPRSICSWVSLSFETWGWNTRFNTGIHFSQSCHSTSIASLFLLFCTGFLARHEVYRRHRCHHQHHRYCLARYGAVIRCNSEVFLPLYFFIVLSVRHYLHDLDPHQCSVENDGVCDCIQDPSFGQPSAW